MKFKSTSPDPEVPPSLFSKTHLASKKKEKMPQTKFFEHLFPFVIRFENILFHFLFTRLPAEVEKSLKFKSEKSGIFNLLDWVELNY